MNDRSIYRKNQVAFINTFLDNELFLKDELNIKKPPKN